MLKRLSKLAAFLAVAVLGLGLLYQPAHAIPNGLIITSRTNDYYLELPDPLYFSGAQDGGNIYQTYVGNGFQQYTWNLGAAYSAKVTGVSNVVVSYTFTPPTLVDTVTLITIPGTTDLSWIEHSNPPIIENGHYVLDESWTSNGGVNNGFPYTWQMTIPGNWSNAGQSQGDHDLLAFNSAYWTIDQNFVFNGTNTIFQAQATGGYQGQNINLDFQLYGAPVPVPPSLVLLGSGLLGLMGLRRFRKG